MYLSKREAEYFMSFFCIHFSPSQSNFQPDYLASRRHFIPPSFLIQIWKIFATELSAPAMQRGESVASKFSPLIHILNQRCRHSLSELVCAYHHATMGLSPMHAIYAFSFIVKCVLYLSCEKNKNKQKEAGFGPFK